MLYVNVSYDINSPKTGKPEQMWHWFEIEIFVGKGKGKCNL